MPELPEVEIVRRGLGPAIMDKHVKNIILNRSDLRGGIPANFRSIIEKNRIIATQRRGKYILVFTDSGAGFVLHLGMSGGIHIHRPEEAYHPAKHDHVIFTMDDDTRVIFNDPRRFGMLYLTHAKTWEKEAPFDVMGPEPLAAAALGLVVFFAAWLIGFGPVMAVSPIVAQTLGAHPNDRARVRAAVRPAFLPKQLRDAEDDASPGQDLGRCVVLGKAKWVPHGHDVEAATDLDVLGDAGEVHRHHQEIRDALRTFRLEVVLGHPERIVAEPVHGLGVLFGLVEGAGQLLVRVVAVIDRCAEIAAILHIDGADVGAVEILEHGRVPRSGPATGPRIVRTC